MSGLGAQNFLGGNLCFEGAAMQWGGAMSLIRTTLLKKTTPQSGEIKYQSNILGDKNKGKSTPSAANGRNMHLGGQARGGVGAG